MALADESMGTTMLVQPSNSNGFGGFGDGGWWILLLFILLGGGNFGNGFGDGGLYPWMNQAGITTNGFQNQLLNDNITSIRDGVNGISNQLCSGFAGVNASVNGAQNAITQQLYTNQISDLERSFAAQTANTAGLTALQAQLAQCCCDNRAATADLKYTVATEACADRSAISDALRDVLTANTASTQRILDQLCQDKIDAKNDTIAQLRQELLFARGQASQDVQTADLRANNATVANQLISELRSCPIPSMPVYGNQAIFSCGGQCGCNG